MTQNERILKALENDGSLTSWEAMTEFGIMRISARIAELRADGIPIKTEMIKAVNRYGEPIRYAKYTLGGAKVG